MDTKNKFSAKIPAVRTYARDLEENRKAKGLVADSAVSKDDVAPVKKVDSKKDKKEVLEPEGKMPELVPVPKNEQVVPLPPLSKIQASKKSPTKVVTVNTKNSSFIVDENDDVGATIISDTKRDRFKLIPEIIDSIKGWFTDKKTAYKTRKVPKYTVPERTRR